MTSTAHSSMLFHSGPSPLRTAFRHRDHPPLDVLYRGGRITNDPKDTAMVNSLATRARQKPHPGTPYEWDMTKSGWSRDDFSARVGDTLFVLQDVSHTGREKRDYPTTLWVIPVNSEGRGVVTYQGAQVTALGHLVAQRLTEIAAQNARSTVDQARHDVGL